MRTLRNAVEQGKVHHAYLFVGSRGTGKTSMAKILAACLNCEGAPTRPTTEPCGRCPSCVAIANATSLDVVEMDAASNNSVDDIRDLRERVQFAPVAGGYKVYILDEAHMLSSAAWNAFLKTLEEPPPNTIFVLATTEAHKVMDTVVDRCHRFDFTRPTVEQLAAVVDRVARQEQIEVGADAVALVARHATGSFRDALGTLEQLVTYAGRTIGLEDVLAVLGVADDELLFGAVEAVAAGDAAEALRGVARLADSGRDLGQFARDLEGHAREVLVVQTLGEVPVQLRLTPDRDERLLAQARAVRGGDVVRLLDLLAAGMRMTREGADARTQLELALVKAAAPEVDGSTRALLARVERLEAALAAGGAPPAPAAPSAAAAPPAPVAPPRAPAPAPPARAAASPGPAAAPPEAAPAPRQAAPQPQAVAAPAPPQPQAAAATASAVAPEPELPQPAAAAAVVRAPVARLDLDGVRDVWPSVVATLKEQSLLHGMTFDEARPLRCEDGEITLAFAPAHAFHRRKCEDPEFQRPVVAAFADLLGVRPRLAFEVAELEQAAPKALSDTELVERLVEEFDAEIVDPEAQAAAPAAEETPS